MRQTINAIRDAIEKECWLPALALALTIPDVMGQIVYPEYASPRGKDSLENNTNSGSTRTSNPDLLTILDLMRIGGQIVHTFPPICATSYVESYFILAAMRLTSNMGNESPGETIRMTSSYAYMPVIAMGHVGRTRVGARESKSTFMSA